MNEKLAKTLHFIKQYISPYLSVALIVGFVIWHLFILKDNSYIDICKNDAHIRALKQEIAQEEATIQQLQEEINNSESDVATINRIACEKHGMQRPHEDVFMIVESPTDTTTIQ